MNRKPLFAIAAFVVLGIVALFALRQPEKGESAGDRERPLSKLDAASFDTIEVTRAGAKATIKKDGDKFKLTEPVAYAADDVAAKAAFEALTGLSLGDLVTENKAKHAEFEVDDGKGIHVVAKSEKAGGKVAADFLVGKAVGTGTMVRLAGKDAVWLAGGALRGTFDKAPADWRDKSIAAVPAADVETLTVKAKDGTVAVARKATTPAGADKAAPPPGGDDKWELVSSTPKIDKLDAAIPAGIVSALSSFKTNDFADGAAPAVTGLDAPALTVTVGLKGGKSSTILIGNKKGDEDWYVKTADAPQVFLVKKYNLERINKRPVEWKDKMLCDVAEADLAEVAVTNGADSFTLSRATGSWKATKPAKLELDPAKTPTPGGGFKDFKATGIAEDPSPAATGLAKPKATIVAKAKKGDACSFKVGDETKDKQGVYLTSAKSTDVYVAPKWAVDRILVKVDDLKKK
jgi:hypothetical protein